GVPQMFAVRTGDLIHIPASVYHQTVNTGDSLMEILAVYSPCGPEMVLRALPDRRELPVGPWPDSPLAPLVVLATILQHRARNTTCRCYPDAALPRDVPQAITVASHQRGPRVSAVAAYGSSISFADMFHSCTTAF